MCVFTVVRQTRTVNAMEQQRHLVTLVFTTHSAHTSRRREVWSLRKKKPHITLVDRTEKCSKNKAITVFSTERWENRKANLFKCIQLQRNKDVNVQMQGDTFIWREKEFYWRMEPELTGLEAEVLSDGGIMSGARVEGGSMPLFTFCWMKCMARANCSWFSLPVCFVSARPLWRQEVVYFKKENTPNLFSRNCTVLEILKNKTFLVKIQNPTTGSRHLKPVQKWFVFYLFLALVHHPSEKLVPTSSHCKSRSTPLTGWKPILHVCWGEGGIIIHKVLQQLCTNVEMALKGRLTISEPASSERGWIAWRSLWCQFL